MKKLDENDIKYNGNEVNAAVIDGETQTINMKKIDLTDTIKTVDSKIIAMAEDGSEAFAIYCFKIKNKKGFRFEKTPKYTFQRAVYTKILPMAKGVWQHVDLMVTEYIALIKEIEFLKSDIYEPEEIFNSFVEQKIKADNDKSEPISEFIRIENDGKEIVSTDFFDSERSKKGKFAVSYQGRTFRFLLPITGQYDSIINDAGKIQSVAMTQNHQKMWELMFDDRSDAPLALHFTETSFLDFIPQFKKDDGWVNVLIYKKGKTGCEKVFERKAFLRSVNAQIPYLDPLGDLEK